MSDWPWNEFPEDLSTWEHCVKQYTALKKRCESLQKVVDAAALLRDVPFEKEGFRKDLYKLYKALQDLEWE